jgi:hypothetical protein
MARHFPIPVPAPAAGPPSGRCEMPELLSVDTRTSAISPQAKATVEYQRNPEKTFRTRHVGTRRREAEAAIDVRGAGGAGEVGASMSHPHHRVPEYPRGQPSRAGPPTQSAPRPRKYSATLRVPALPGVACQSEARAVGCRSIASPWLHVAGVYGGARAARDH